MSLNRLVAGTLWAAITTFADLQGLAIVPAAAQEKPAAGSDDRPSLHAETVERLRKFLVFVRRDDTDDKAIFQAITELNARIEEQHLATVERFALTDEAKPYAFGFARLLVDRKRYDGAADAIVNLLVSEKENRGLRMWKWWEHGFGERKDYKEMSKQMTHSLLRQFSSGGVDRKQVVAELFGLGDNEAKLPAEEFQKMILNKIKD